VNVQRVEKEDLSRGREKEGEREGNRSRGEIPGEKYCRRRERDREEEIKIKDIEGETR
jgi:hypothetical protein